MGLRLIRDKFEENHGFDMFRPLRQACQVSLEILAFSHTVHGHEANTSGHVTEESSISVCRKHYQSLELSFQLLEGSCQPWRPWIDVGIGWLLLMALAALAPLFDDIFKVLICEWCRICYELYATPESQRTTPGVPKNTAWAWHARSHEITPTVVLSFPKKVSGVNCTTWELSSDSRDPFFGA
jgi:hypothetical protein